MIILDSAAWHRSNDLVSPRNLSLVRLLPCSQELNSMENIFNHLKSNFLNSNSWRNTPFSTVECLETQRSRHGPGSPKTRSYLLHNEADSAIIPALLNCKGDTWVIFRSATV